MLAGSSMYGYVTKKDLSALGRFFMMAMIGLVVAIIANIFIGSSIMSLGISALVVLFSAGITAYETQMIRNIIINYHIEGPFQGCYIGCIYIVWYICINVYTYIKHYGTDAKISLF